RAGPAGCALGEHAVLVRERDGDAVDLQLNGVRRARTDRLLDAYDPRFQLLARERVIEREHARAMLHGSEQVGRGPADALRGAVGGDELGELLLETRQLAHQLVVFGIGDLRIVQDVVPVRMEVDELTELFHAYLGRGARAVPA